jgi:glycosyltransferase involved in cell wall biosynthesis
MRFTFINQFYPPDEAPTGLLLADVAEELVRQGHEVQVICGQGGYRQMEGGRGNSNGVQVVRVREMPFTRAQRGRLSSYLSFLVLATLRGLKESRTDVLVTLTTPPLLHLAGSLTARLHGCKHYLWEMDLYPDVAIAAGTMDGVARLVGPLLDHARHRCQGILALGECMKARLVSHGIRPEKIHVAENWADGDAIRPAPFPQGPLTLLYSGNLGLAHEVDSLQELLKRLPAPSRFRLRLAGGGVGLNRLREDCRSDRWRNISFEPHSPLSRLSDHLADCHIGLVTQKRESLGCIVPSKVYGLLAAGRPVLFIGPKEATSARIIERYGCGWQVEPGKVEALCHLLLELEKNREEILRAGVKARQAFEAQYDRRIGVNRVCQILLEHPSTAQRGWQCVLR